KFESPITPSSDSTAMLKAYYSFLDQKKKAPYKEISGTYSSMFPPAKDEKMWLKLSVDKRYVLFFYDKVISKGDWEIIDNELFLTDDELNCSFLLRKEGDVLVSIELLNIKHNFIRVP